MAFEVYAKANFMISKPFGPFFLLHQGLILLGHLQCVALDIFSLISSRYTKYGSRHGLHQRTHQGSHGSTG